MSGFSIVEVGSRRYRVRAGLGGRPGGAGGGFGDSQGVAARAGGSERESIAVPRQLHRLLIGRHGATIERLREQSRAKITVPGERSRSDRVEIEGLAEERARARELIAQVVEAGMASVPYTHFLSLPVADADVQRRVGEFQRDAGSGHLRGAGRAGFVQPGSLHITVGMLRLLTPADVARAVALLKSLGDEVRQALEGRPLVVAVGRLAAMEPDPARARVIYACAEDFEDRDRGRLERVCRLVRGRFDSEGFIDEKRELKIHITIVRAAGGAKEPGAKDADAKEPGAKDAAGARGGSTVDARPLLKEFAALSFGVCRLGQIQIARRFARTETGAYESDGAIALP
ncbi:activating signal cointegrator 1 complex subunit [Coemansia javaensis]|uniref:Activating signal cointegrator 1 complex subunit n=1 Tax=Coemansia javaensis TaxID=2761396 RepID=A0A9W8H510_9FUNG|nr:activating signal cointegrator 1 complex subunit [Coemansia javaensis]